jgi:tetratricopeptide (TPR) repeat protein
MGDMDKIRLNKKVVLSVLGVLVVLVLATGAGIGLRLLQNDKAADEDGVSSFKGQPLPERVDEAQNLRVSGDVDGSIKKIDEALNDGNVSKGEKYQLYIQQGNAYYDKKDTDAAIASYLKAESVDKTYEIVSLLATMYEEAGNKEKAIEYYKKSIPLIPNTPMRVQYKTDAENKIKELGGQS